MAKHEIVMPQMGESITNGTITKWHKAVGDTIEIDEILFEISTDKVESEIPSPISGRVDEILFEEGETVDVSILIATIEDDLSQPVSTGSKSASSSAPDVKVSEDQTSKVEVVETIVPNENTNDGRFYTPLVKAMAADAGVSLSELANISGSGSAGRVNKADFLNFISTRSGSKNTAALAAPKSNSATAVVSAGSTASVSASGDRVEVIAMSNMRKAIAKNMVISKQTSPHVNSLSEVDLTHLVKFREGFKEEFFKQEGFKLTYTPFLMKAIIDALKEFPMVNSSIDGDNIVIKKDINLGCAVAVPGSGLVVPVIHNADTLNMTGLCRAINSLAAKARAKKLTMGEMTGGTFTFTNVGSFGTLMATPVILQPQLGIYAAGVIQKRVMAMKDDAIAVRSMMYGTHAYDHRLIDGEMGGKFLEAIHRNLRDMNPETMF